MSAQRTITQRDQTAGPSCATCDFGRLGVAEEFLDGSRLEVINCHRFPPARDRGWPQLLPGEWCGEHEYRDRFHPDITAKEAGAGA